MRRSQGAPSVTCQNNSVKVQFQSAGIADAAGLDYAQVAEREITQTIASLKGDRTIITIAHRLSTIRDCDRLYFLEDGALRDEGTYDELEVRNAAFRRMTESVRTVAET